MDNRKYNIYFHTHTVSGIIVCVLLYVVFFAGSFAFFKDDIAAWQKNSSYVVNRKTTPRDFTGILDSLGRHHQLKGRNIEFFLQRHGTGAYVSMLASNDSIVNKEGKARALARAKANPAGEPKKRGRGRGRGGDEDVASFTYDFAHRQEVDYEKDYDMGEFLYRLHFLAPLNAIRLPINLGAPFGYLLAGIVSFMFLFALITGLLLHWNKIVSNFFTFRPWAKWKTVWTDLHTGLGMIQFPFQFLFAVTGMVLIVNSVLLAPFTKFAYNGDSEQLYSDLQTADNTKYAYTYTPLAAPFNLNQVVAQVEQKWADSEITRVLIRNYQDANMHVVVLGAPHAEASFSGLGKLVYRVRDQQVLSETAPAAPSTYVSKVRSLVYHLHFGDFGGRPLRVMYFVLGLLGCVVILSGILIWLVARDKNSTPMRERKFNFWTANIFLAVCLSMLPVTALTMISLLFLKQPTQADIYHWYFYSWLALGIYFIARHDIASTNRQSLVLSAGLCFLVPVLDGVVRDNWFWNTFAKGQFDILFVDMLFLGLSIISAVVLLKMNRRQEVAVLQQEAVAVVV
ncbi:PepSY-associated TM helix domain-containing protein [Hymenobacter metallicola]|uniref:PepSY domain-containing protein n=1 Tax=Hymenobacter metallicola TaxID=2563114 RepID=A0A4Z0PU49_9BACT|nr:PepSY-associated TM helix domain-containing protein [Hymenobacter metallicola]TGE21015.1 PepSY domain-containing protein [Hymenobacter metallicola]